MIIEIRVGSQSIYSQDEALLLPDINIEAESPITVSGLSEQYPHMLAISLIGITHLASFFLHPHITAHVKIGNFNIYLTNTEILIACLVCLPNDFFKITQSRKERISSYTFQGYHDFVTLKERETTIIESFDMTGKDTDKIGCI